MQDSKVVISRLRTGPVWIVILIVLAIAAFSIRGDLRGSGVNQTLLFDATGPLAYPIYYGILIVCLVGAIRTFRFKDDWLTISDGEVRIARRKMSLDDLRGVEVTRTWIGAGRIVLHGANGQDLAIGTLLLASPLSKVVPALKARINARYDQPSLSSFEA